MSGTLSSMLAGIAGSLPGLQSFLMILVYFVGLGMVGAGLYRFAVARDGVATDAFSAAAALGMVLAGSALVAFDAVIPAVSATLFAAAGATSPMLAYTTVGGSLTDEIYQVAVDVIQLLGLASVARGIYLLGHAMGGDPRENAFWRGVTHVFGGALAINIIQFAQVLSNTLGISF